MKKLLTIGTACFITITFSGCFGLISKALTHGKSTVSLMQAPEDLQVKCNGVEIPITSEMFATSSNIGATVTTDYYTSAIKLPSKRATTIELYSPSQNKRATVELKPKSSRNIIWADIIFTAGASLLIDIPTGSLKMLTPRLLDVESALAGKPRSQWLSHHKLKKMGKRRAKHS
jgi:hypothetical protein